MGAQNRGVKSENVRASNMSTVLRNILASPGEVTRAGLSQRTGMTRATISRLVDDLVGAGLVRELEPGDGGGRGRPANRLTPAEGSAVALGVEVDVASLDVMLVDIAGRELGHRRIERDFADSAPEETMALAAREAHALLEGALPDGALFLGTGVGLPGLVSPSRLALAPNLGWRDIPHDQLLAPLADLNPVVVANEADLAAYAVAYTRPGVAGGPSTFVYVSGEVGVGAGVIVDHRPMSGARAWSGEIGHMCADPNGPLCRCGARGCLEAYLGVRALAEHVGAPAGFRGACNSALRRPRRRGRGEDLRVSWCGRGAGACPSRAGGGRSGPRARVVRGHQRDGHPARRAGRCRRGAEWRPAGSGARGNRDAHAAGPVVLADR